MSTTRTYQKYGRKERTGTLEIGGKEEHWLQQGCTKTKSSKEDKTACKNFQKKESKGPIPTKIQNNYNPTKRNPLD